MKQRRNQGITLIALVITIIVLLILTGVSIAMLTGQNGILNQATGAKESNNKATALEKVQTEVMGSYSQDGKIDITKLNENLNHIKNIQGTPITRLPATVIVDGFEVEVNSNGNVAIWNVENKKIAEVKPGEGQNVTFVTANTKIKDDKGNQVVIPKGFGIAKDSATIVTDGVVIVDVDGNQFVWIPVGTVTKSDGTTAEIKLSRYTFAEDGTPTEQGENIIEGYFTEDTVGNHNSSYGNIIAKDIEGFKTSGNNNNGYYIGRYEASYRDGNKPYCKVSTGIPATLSNTVKTEGMLWNWITQPAAAIAARNMYNSSDFTSDLINSYAWDTAIVFIQTFSGDRDYARQNSLNTSLANTGVNGDERCHIHDMASNNVEWVTETSSFSGSPCTCRGGVYFNNYNYTSYRSYSSHNGIGAYFAFRPLLYL